MHAGPRKINVCSSLRENISNLHFIIISNNNKSRLKHCKHVIIEMSFSAGEVEVIFLGQGWGLGSLGCQTVSGVHTHKVAVACAHPFSPYQCCLQI